jgi:hypothetical protein
VWENTVLLLVWILCVPPAAALVADDITQEKIFQRFTAWIDRRFRGSLIAYLFRCNRCLSHWTVGVFWLLYLPVWATLPFTPYIRVLISIILLITAIRYARGWLE